MKQPSAANTLMASMSKPARRFVPPEGSIVVEVTPEQMPALWGEIPDLNYTIGVVVEEAEVLRRPSWRHPRRRLAWVRKYGARRTEIKKLTKVKLDSISPERLDAEPGS